MKPLRFHEEAEVEAVATVRWYLERSTEAAEAFDATLREAAHGVREHPRRWPFWPGRADVRRRLLPGFPFSIVYLDEPDVIFVVAIAHARRRPGYWLPRLR